LPYRIATEYRVHEAVLAAGAGVTLAVVDTGPDDAAWAVEAADVVELGVEALEVFALEALAGDGVTMAVAAVADDEPVEAVEAVEAGVEDAAAAVVVLDVVEVVDVATTNGSRLTSTLASVAVFLAGSDALAEVVCVVDAAAAPAAAGAAGTAGAPAEEPVLSSRTGTAMTATSSIAATIQSLRSTRSRRRALIRQPPVVPPAALVAADN
jgi:hypothetical protein